MNELFRRAAPGLAVAGVALSTVWLFDPALHPSNTASVAASSTDSSGSTDGMQGTTPDDWSTRPDGGTRGGPNGSGTTGEGGSSGTTTVPDTTASADCGSDTTAQTGDEAWTQWGPVQVQMTFAADGSVCSVAAVAYPNNDPHSSRINATAVPILNTEALQSGVSFDAVSGATYTSEAYRESMQSILDRM